MEINGKKYEVVPANPFQTIYLQRFDAGDKSILIGELMIIKPIASEKKGIEKYTILVLDKSTQKHRVLGTIVVGNP